MRCKKPRQPMNDGLKLKKMETSLALYTESRSP